MPKSRDVDALLTWLTTDNYGSLCGSLTLYPPLSSNVASSENLPEPKWRFSSLGIHEEVSSNSYFDDRMVNVCTLWSTSIPVAIENCHLVR